MEGRMLIGANVHSSRDGRLLCSFSEKVCSQRRMEGYGFCIKHILEDPSSPFRRCEYRNENTKKQCRIPIHVDEEERWEGRRRRGDGSGGMRKEGRSLVVKRALLVRKRELDGVKRDLGGERSMVLFIFSLKDLCDAPPPSWNAASEEDTKEIDVLS